MWSFIPTAAAWRRALRGMITRPWVILQLSAWHPLPVPFPCSPYILPSSSISGEPLSFTPPPSLCEPFFFFMLSQCFIYSCRLASVLVMPSWQRDKYSRLSFLQCSGHLQLKSPWTPLFIRIVTCVRRMCESPVPHLSRAVRFLVSSTEGHIRFRLEK